MAGNSNINDKNSIVAYSWQYVAGVLFAFFTVISASSPAFAVGPEFDTIGKNMVESSDQMPGLIAAFSYIMALILAITGILKLKEHVNNPTQVPLRTPVIRFLVGGGLLALPIVYESMASAINGGQSDSFDPGGTAGGMVSKMLGFISSWTFGAQGMLNDLMGQIISSVSELPGVVAAFAYILALLLGVAGLLKLKDHVENPEQTPLREPVIRILAGGALFAITTVYNAMDNLFGGPGVMGQIGSIIGAANMVFSSYGMDVCKPPNGVGGAVTGAIGGAVSGGLGGAASGAASGFMGGGKMSALLCGFVYNAGAFPALMSALSYLFGLVLGVWGILKIKAHVLNPQQTSIWEGVSRLVAGGAFFSLPVVIEVLRNTMGPIKPAAVAAAGQVTKFNEKAMSCDGKSGLDGALYCFMDDLLTPAHVALNFFATAAAFVLAMIGISRLMKSAQDGARAPGGLGTIMTFMAAGALLSYNAIMRMFSTTLAMADPALQHSKTNAVMQYVQGMTPDEQQHAHTVISAILKFMIVIGLVSFVRGIFIIRSVAEGNSQASMMAGITHMVGGALAVNLGGLINAVQDTLGIAQYGINFS